MLWTWPENSAATEGNAGPARPVEFPPERLDKMPMNETDGGGGSVRVVGQRKGDC